MSVEQLTVSCLRIVAHADLAPSPDLNLITGPNAAGKTSLLEAIDVLARGRSFRTHRLDRLLTTGQRTLTISARLACTDQAAIGVGLEKSRSGARVRIRGQTVASVAELARLLPVQVLHPESHQLIQGGPQYRREYLNWGTFHVEPQFLSTWRRYQRALNQRNAALRASADTATVCAWHKEMAETAGHIDAHRRDYLRALVPVFLTYARVFFVTERIDLSYLPGWPEQHELKRLLDDAVLADRERGFTRYGPHRAELEIRVDGRSAVGSVSRGQQKLLAAALRLAQTRLLIERTGARSLFLIDDLPAELERRHRASLLQALTQLGSQVFVTAIEPGELELGSTPRWKRFHVEQGRIHELL